MQEMTRDYRAAVYADARWSVARVVFRLVDITAAEDAEPSANSAAYLSRLGQTHNGVIAMERKLATLERDYWALDGTFDLPAAEMPSVETGWWSGVLSGAGGVFRVPPSLCFDFAQNHASVGFTVYFDNAAAEWPEDFDILTFDAAGKRTSVDEVRGNVGPVYISNAGAEDYRRVELVFRKTTKPFRRVRVVEVVFGVVQTYEPDNTAQLRLLYELDLRMEALPVGEMTITIDNRNRMYNLVNPNGAYRYLQEGQPMDSAIGVGERKGGVEFCNMGRHYFYKSSAKDSGMTAEITARDRLFLLDKGRYRRGSIGQCTVFALVADVLDDSGTGMMATISPDVGNVMVGRCLPVCSHREALRLIAQAARAVCFMGRDDAVWFLRPQEGEPSDTLNMGNMESPPDISAGERVNVVEVSAYALKGKKETEEQETLYEGTVALNGQTELWAVYSGPARAVSAETTSGTLVKAEYYLYAARLVLTGSGDATVRVIGVSLEQSESIYTLRDVGQNDSEQSVSLENPLIFDTDGAKALAEWRLSLERRRLTYPIRERGNPAREIGDTIQVFDAYGENRNAIVTKQELSYDGTLSGDTTAQGGGL